MTKIKGQNLRILVGSAASQNCIAASQSCTVHLAATIEDSTSKDSDGDWTENEVTELSWDASVEAAVTNDIVLKGTYLADTGDTTEVPVSSISGASGSSNYFIQNSMRGFVLRPGETISTSQIFQCPISLLKELGNGEYQQILYNEGSQPNMTYTNETATDMTISFAYVGTENVEDGEDITLTIKDGGYTSFETLQEYMENKTTVTVVFATTEGTKNRETDTLIAAGTALISDLNATAQNKQKATFSCKLTGIGELEFS